MKRLLKTFSFFVLLLLYGCNGGKPIYIISSSQDLQLPFRASEFFGFFDKEGIEIQLDSAPDKSSLIRFLNFSKYTVVITDSETARKIENLSSRWSSICIVALNKKEKKPISKGKKEFVLLMKDVLLNRQKEAVNIIKGWNYGVDLLKDPAVVELLSKGNVPYRFLHCGK